MNNIEMLPSWFISVYVFLFGLCIGSFLNVFILRGLNGEDMVFSRSHCPECNKQLKWYMNIPLLSYLFLGGKCAFCKTKISIQYPIVELLTAALFVFTFQSFGITLKSLLFCVIFFFFIAMIVTDILDTSIILKHSFFALFFCLLCAFLGFCNVGIIDSLFGAFDFFIILELLSFLGLIFINYRFFGDGDSFIALSIGALFGLKNSLIVFLLSTLIMFIFSLPTIIKKAFSSNSKKKITLYLIALISTLSIVVITRTDLIQNIFFYLLTWVLFIVCIVSLIKTIPKIKSDEEETKTDLFKTITKSLFTPKPANFAILLALLLVFTRNLTLLNSQIVTLFDFTIRALLLFGIYKNNLDFYKNTNNEEVEFEQAQEMATILPFGPALLISTIICVFFLENIKEFILNYIQ